MLDRREDGTDNAGARHGMSKLTEEQVLEIREIGRSRTLTQLSRQYGVGTAQLSDILTRKAWKHI